MLCSNWFYRSSTLLFVGRSLRHLLTDRFTNGLMSINIKYECFTKYTERKYPATLYGNRFYRSDTLWFICGALTAPSIDPSVHQRLNWWFSTATWRHVVLRRHQLRSHDVTSSAWQWQVTLVNVPSFSFPIRLISSIQMWRDQYLC